MSRIAAFFLVVLINLGFPVLSHAAPFELQMGERLRLEHSSAISYFVPNTNEDSALSVLVRKDLFKAGSHTGWLDKPVWLRFEVKSRGETPSEWIFYCLSNFLHDEFQFFLIQDGKIIGGQRSGSDVEAGVRGQNGRLIGARWSLTPNQPYEVLIRIKTSQFLLNDLEVTDAATFNRLMIKFQSQLGVYWGVALTSGVFSFIFAFSLRNRAFLAYGAFCISLVILNLVHNGYLDVWGAGGSIIRGRYAEPALMALPAFFGAWFVKNLFELRRLSSRIDKLAGAFMGAALLTALIRYIPGLSNVGSMAADFVTCSFGVFSIFVGIQVSRAGMQGGRLYLAAWAILGAAAIVWFAVMYGLLPLTDVNLYSVIYGQLAELFILSFIMLERLRDLGGAAVLATSRAEESERLKSLLGALHHDLNTPLMVLSYSLAACEKYGAEVTQLARPIARGKTAVKNISSIIQHVANMRSADEGNIRLFPVSINIGELLESILEQLDSRIQDKFISVGCDEKSWAGVTVLGDATVLSQTVLGNVLTNAIKFSPVGGKIEIRASVVGQEVCIEVRDFGAGISPEILKGIESGRPVKSTPGSVGEMGTGFGLQITQAFARRMNGRVEFGSPKDGGTLVRIVLPRGA